MEFKIEKEFAIKEESNITDQRRDELLLQLKTITEEVIPYFKGHDYSFGLFSIVDCIEEKDEKGNMPTRFLSLAEGRKSDLLSIASGIVDHVAEEMRADNVLGAAILDDLSKKLKMIGYTMANAKRLREEMIEKMGKELSGKDKPDHAVIKNKAST